MSVSRAVLRSCQASLRHATLPHSPCPGTKNLATHVAKTSLHTSTRPPRLRPSASGNGLINTHRHQKLPLRQGWRCLSSSRVCRQDRIEDINGPTPTNTHRGSANGSGGSRRHTSELPTKVKMVLDTPGKTRERNKRGYSQ